MLKNVIIAIIFIVNSYFSLGQEVSIIEIQLPKSINETSGLEYFQGNFITHNDSGGKSEIYCFNKSGKLLDSININQVENIDWEDITRDDNFYYIADTGNNYGTRSNQSIYKLDQNLSFIGKISISYTNQNDFTKRVKHPFDAEALVDYGDQLLLFSKDRENLRTDIYSISKEVINQELSSKESFEVNSLITGGDFDSKTNTLVLTSYNFSGEQFLFLIPDFKIPYLNKRLVKKFLLNVGPAQIEAVKIESPNVFWLTSEDEGDGFPRLFKVELL